MRSLQSPSNAGMNNCLVSLITPCLNAEKTLGATLDSVKSVSEELALHGWQLQHLLVDGGSSDSTLDIWDGYAKNQPFRQILFNVAGGPYPAMQAGLLLANGIYTHILNADDQITNPVLYAEHLINAQALSSVVILSSISYFRKSAGQITRTWSVDTLPRSRAAWKQQLANGLHYPHPGFIAMTERYQSVGFDLSYSLSSDYKTMQLILLGLADGENVRVVTKPLVAMAEGGLTTGLGSILEGRNQIQMINRELGIEHSSLRRYSLKILQVFKRNFGKG